MKSNGQYTHRYTSLYISQPQKRDRRSPRLPSQASPVRFRSVGGGQAIRFRGSMALLRLLALLPIFWVAPTVAQTTELDVNKPTLTINEGTSDSSAFTVKLTSAPTGAVTVSISSTNTDVKLNPTSLSFGTDDWDSPKSVALKAFADVERTNDSATVNINASGGGYDNKSKTISVTVTDLANPSNAPDLTISEMPSSLTEGGSGTFKVQLANEPSENVTLTLSSSNSDVTPSSSLSFTASNWNTEQTVTLNAAEDDDAAADTATITLAAAGGNYEGLSKTTASVSVQENDQAGLTLSGNEISGSTLTFDEGGADKTFTVILDAQPTGGNVSVAITKSGSGDVSVSPASMTFGGNNWNSTQTVTVSVGQDDDAANDSATITIDPDGADYTNVASKTVSVTVNDDDSKSLVLSAPSLTVDEGDNDTITVRLGSEPAGGNVTISVSKASGGSGDVSATPANLSFDANDWQTPKTLTITAAEDNDAVDESTTTFNLSASGGDYGSITDSFTVSVTENDSVDLVLNPAASLSFNEGSNRTFTVKLDSVPSANVTVSTNSNNADVKVSPANLTFTTSNWNQEQDVTLKGFADVDRTNESASIQLSASGGGYDNKSKTLAVTLTDLPSPSNAPDLTISDMTSLTEGGSGTFKVRLANEPSDNVTLTLTSSNSDVTPSSSLSFTTSNWNTEQTVTLNAAEDDDAAADTATITLAATGGNYEGLSKPTATITVTENDSVDLVLNPAASLSFNEGSNRTFTVKLDSVPSANVTVSTNSNNADVKVSPANLTFTTSNWNQEQDVTLKGFADVDRTNESASIQLSASGGGYDNKSKTLAVTLTDLVSPSNAPDLTISNMPSLNEGSTATFTVELSNEPSEQVVLTLEQPSNTDITLDTDTAANNNQNTLTFTTSNWNTEQTVTLSAAEDNDAATDTTTIAITAAGGNYQGLSKTTANITVTENDETGVVLSDSTLTINEGNTQTFTVKLESEPTGAVTAAITSSENEITISPASLSFAVGNWNSAQTVTLTSISDVDRDDDSATITINPDGADYATTENETLTVTVTDLATPPNAPELDISKTTLSFTEQSSDTFTVKLKNKPTADVTLTLAQPSNTDNTDITLDTDTSQNGNQNKLTFTPDNWDSAQTVTVAAADDADGVKDDATITITATGGNYEGLSLTGSDAIMVEVNDNDDPGIVASSVDAIDEGQTGTLNVKLATQPIEDVTLALAQTSQTTNSDITLDKNSLTFTSANWNIDQSVVISSAQDDDAVDDATIIAITVSSGSSDEYNNVDAKNVTVSVTDDEEAGFVISGLNDTGNSRTLAWNEGTNATFTIKLSSEPTATTTVSIAQTDPENLEVVVDSNELSFTADNWDTAQTLTLRSISDADRDNDSATFDIKAAGANEYDEVDDISLTVTINDSATPENAPALVLGGDRLEQNQTRLELEEGVAFDMNVKLAHRPTADAILTFTTGGDSANKLSISAGGDGAGRDTLTFTPDNWNSDQRVRFFPLEDLDVDADSGDVQIAITGPSNYRGLQRGIDFNIADNDSYDIRIHPRESPINVNEGSSEYLSVRLGADPGETSSVTIDVSLDGAVNTIIDKTTLRFNTSDWGRSKFVKITSARDADADNENATLSLSISDDENNGPYKGKSTSIDVEVADNFTGGDFSPNLLFTDTPVVLAEGGSATFTVRLNVLPTEDVTLTFTVPGDSDLTVDADSVAEGAQNTLIFTSSNWEEARTVSVSAAIDEDGDDDSSSIGIVAGGGSYDTLSRSVLVSVEDVAEINLVVDPTSLNIDEGASGTFTVALASRPSDDVGVDLTPPSVDKITVDTDPGTPGNQSVLNFTLFDWNRPKTVIVAGATDDDKASESGTIRLLARGGGYAGKTGAVTVRINDTTRDENLVIPPSLVSSPLAIDEGQSASFTIRLSHRPQNDTTIDLRVLDNPDIVVSPERLVFTTENWGRDQSVDVRVAEDRDIADENGSISLTGGSEGFFAGQRLSIVVRITDNDEEPVPLPPDDPSLILENVPPTIAEGGIGSFSLSLASRPNAAVEIIAERAEGAIRLSADPTAAAEGPGETRISLAFTVDNWNEAQVIMVLSDHDDDSADNSVRIAFSASGGGYDDATGSVRISIVDDDEPAFVIEGAPVTVLKGGTNSFTVKLATRPAGTVIIAVDRPRALNFVLDTDESVAGSQSTLAFTPADWSLPKKVMLAVSEDSDDVVGASETLSIRATGGDYASVTGSVVVSIDEVDAPAAWLTRFGRATGRQAVESIEDRMERQRIPGTASMRIAGREIEAGDPDLVLAPTDEPSDIEADALSFKDVIAAGTNFDVVGSVPGGGSLALWGQGAYSRFGGEEIGVDIEGETITGIAGMDFAKRNWMLGIMAMHSVGEGKYHEGNRSTISDISLTSFVPWGSLNIADGVRIWSAVGYGKGELTLTPQGEAAASSDVEWEMMAIGMRDDIVDPADGNGFGFAHLSDFLWTRTRADGLGGRVEEIEGLTRSARFGVELSHLQTNDRSRFIQSLEGALRYDSGDAEQGWGLDVGAGLLYNDHRSGISASLRARALVLHQEDSAARDWGVTASLGWDLNPDSPRGFSARISNDLAPDSALSALLSDEAFPSAQGIGKNSLWEAEVAYGFSQPRGRTGLPYLEFGRTGDTQRGQVGYRLLPGPEENGGLELDIYVVREENENQARKEEDVGVGAVIKYDPGIWQ